MKITHENVLDFDRKNMDRFKKQPLSGIMIRNNDYNHFTKSQGEHFKRYNPGKGLSN